MLYKKDPKMLNQFQYCEREQVPYLVIVGEDEKANGGVKIRNAVSREEVRLHSYQLKTCFELFPLYTGICEI